LDDLIPIARAVVTSPVTFFSALPRQGNYASPLVFALICAEVSALCGGILRVAGGESVGRFIGALIATPIGAAIGLFIIAAIAHLLVTMVAGSPNAGYEATFRVAAYGSVTSLASWIPVVGPLISLYGLYLAVVGIREMHHTTTGQALLVVLIPVACVAVLAFIVAAIAGLALLGLFR
jgi:hypothetical protein